MYLTRPETLIKLIKHHRTAWRPANDTKCHWMPMDALSVLPGLPKK